MQLTGPVQLNDSGELPLALGTARAGCLAGRTDAWLTAKIPWAADRSIAATTRKLAALGGRSRAISSVTSFSIWSIVAGTRYGKWRNACRAEIEIDVDMALAISHETQPARLAIHSVSAVSGTGLDEMSQ